LRRASASVVAAAAVVDLHDLDDRGADQDAIALAQPRATGDLLAVDEGAVGRAHVLDEDLGVGRGDLGVTPRDHVLDQHHVQVAGATDDDLAVHTQGKLAPLVLAGDETECEAWPVGHGARTLVCTADQYATSGKL
jgi:hypothetical protein